MTMQFGGCLMENKAECQITSCNAGDLSCEYMNDTLHIVLCYVISVFERDTKLELCKNAVLQSNWTMLQPAFGTTHKLILAFRA